ncbi:MAG: PQQ-dependent dehydrogenase, methanol/ethanol family [Acidobacteriia bacterium]|nr:PQQ-dependent dehydrogenase, methanol/ethanol family [Terriglobia bacterium]
MKIQTLLLVPALLSAQVSFDRLLHTDKEPQNWLTYSGSVNGQRYSALDKINPQNVRNLELKWVFQARSLEKFETTPLVVDGVMYMTEAPNHVFALDAKTGRIFWDYDYRASKDARVCCGSVNRGLAILGDTLFMGTIDGRLIAIDSKSGKPVWNIEAGDPKLGYSITHAPLVVKDKVVVGVAGGEYGIRGFIAAYDAKTGKEAWRFYTVAGPEDPKAQKTWDGDSWKNGGAPAWLTGSYDPSSNTIYWGTGNPGPDWNGDDRAGDNLYSDSAVALDADTGKLKWHFQFTPHDEFDYDAVQIPVLVDANWQGKPRKLLMWANRNAFFYVFDRETGKFLSGTPFAKENWAIGLDEAGRPMRAPNMSPTPAGTLIYPNLFGATNWYSPSYSPRTQLFYIPSWQDSNMVMAKMQQKYVPGQRYTGGLPRAANAGRRGTRNTPVEDSAYGSILAMDPFTGKKKWEFKMSDVTDSGILTTASDLLFAGGREGYFYALDARNGTELWRASLGGQMEAGPMTYAIDGKQYVTIASGSSLFTFALKE